MPREAVTPDGVVHEFPDGTSDDVMDRAIKDYLGQSSPQTVDPGIVPAPIAEAASAMNRGVAAIPDFFIDAMNAATGLISEDIPKVPRVMDTLQEVTGGAFGQEGFMEPGLARTIVQEGGEVVGGFLPTVVAGAPQVATQVAEKGAKVSRKLLEEAAPTIQRLKAVGRSIYKEIDDLGVRVSQEAVKGLSDDVTTTLRRAGHNRRVTPKAQGVIDELDDLAQGTPTVSELDTARRVARQAALSNEPSERLLGQMAIDKIDDFIDDLPDGRLIGREAERVGPLFKEARSLWSRAKKGEVIEEALRKADLQATGLENGLRIQFRSILNNPKKTKGFTADELEAMRTVVKGTTSANLAKLVGKFGLMDEQAVRAFLPGLGAVAGFGVGGTPGAIGPLAAGTVGQKVARQLTVNNANFAGALTRAGKDGQKIAKAYVNSVPKAQRSSDELALLLLGQGIPKASITNLAKSGDSLIADAAFVVGLISNMAENRASEAENGGQGQETQEGVSGPEEQPAEG